MADIIAETGRLILRTIDDGDAALQGRLLNTPAVMARLGGVKELHEIEARHAKARASYAQEGFSFLMMIEKATGELVGHCGIKRVDNPLAPNQGDHEIGWLVREDRWRRGFAEEAMRAVLDWAFGRVGAPHVVAMTSAANVASWTLMEKLGMRRRADLDFDDPAYPPEDRTTILYSLTSAQWRREMVEFRLETERLILRDWREEDADDFHRLHCDPLVMATLGPVRAMDYTVRLIADLQQRARRNGGHTYWAVERKCDARVIGFCGLDRGHEGTIIGELEIGWRLAHDCWSQGYAGEGASACLEWADEHFCRERVVAITARINIRSRRLMERLGMMHRPDLDFAHPNLAEDDPLRSHVVYAKEQAA